MGLKREILDTESIKLGVRVHSRQENSHSLWMREKQQQETRENETRGGELWVMLYSFFIS